MEIYSSYPVRKIVIEFKDQEVFANGRKFSHIDDVIEWVRECQSLFKSPFMKG